MPYKNKADKNANDRKLYWQKQGLTPDRDVPNTEFRPIRLLIIDIETMANLSWTWDVWQQNIAPSQIVQHKRTISWAGKWLGQKSVLFRSEYHHSREKMVEDAHEILNTADGVIGYNSKRFDNKHLNTEFTVEGYTPPAPFAHIDLMDTIKREFMFGSNKLESVASRMGIGHKQEHEGFALWVKTAAHDPHIHAFYPEISDEDVADAWARMKRYNVQDVKLTEQLYQKILPWITNHPSYAAFSRSEVPMCPNCGAEAPELRQAGWHYARTRRYVRYHCSRCGKWSRGHTAEQITETTETSSY